jgi:hypothetical protein
MSFYEDSSIIITPNAYKAGTLYAVVPTSGLADMDSTRATTATRVDEDGLVADVLSGVPRIDYTGGGCPHILAEPQRTNLILYSQDISNAAWTKSSGGTGSTPVVTANYTASPLEGEMADRVIFNLNGGTASADLSTLQSSSFNLTLGDDFTYYMAVKTNDGSTVNMTLNNNLGLSEVKSITPEWTIIKTSTTATATSSGVLRLRLRGSEAVSDYADVSVSYAQLEEGSYATSYIPTSGSTVTRNKDVFTRGGISSLIGTEGVLFVEMAALSNDGTSRGISLNDGTSSNRLLLYFSAGSNQIAVISTGFTGSINYAVSDETSFNKFAVRYKDNDVTLWIDGASRGTPRTSATIPTFTALKFDSGAGSSPFFGKVKQLQVYPTALSDSELTTLTTP